MGPILGGGHTSAGGGVALSWLVCLVGGLGGLSLGLAGGLVLPWLGGAGLVGRLHGVLLVLLGGVGLVCCEWRALGGASGVFHGVLWADGLVR